MRNMQDQDEVQEGGKVSWEDEIQNEEEKVTCTMANHAKESE